MANPYVDTTLIECNRLQSAQQSQVDTIESNAIFTNRQSNTIIIEQGDKVSVQSAFINQKGCNIPTSLEFKGKYLTDVKIEKTDGLVVKNSKIDIMSRISHIELPEINSEIQAEVFDNKSSLEVNYYKTSNGEQYVFLPRCFIAPTQQPNSNKISTEVWKLWQNSNGTTDHGKEPGSESGTVHYQNIYDTVKFFTNFNDYHAIKDVDTIAPIATINLLRPKNDNKKYTLMTRCYTWTQDSDIDSIEVTIGGVNYKDNGAQMLAYANALGNSINPVKKRFINKLEKTQYDPALTYYVKQVDNIDISVERGFNSAQSVAQQITEDLQKYISDEEDGTFWPSGTNNQGVFSATTTSLLRPRHCASPDVFNKANFDAVNTKSQPALDYLNSYQHILVKRPDLFIAGRKCNNRFGGVPNRLINPVTNEPLTNPTIEETDLNMSGMTTQNFNRNKIDYVAGLENNTTDEIQTSWLWIPENLERLRDLFIEQGKYPDLFESKNCASDIIDDANSEYINYKNIGGVKTELERATIKNSRFLHITRINYDETKNKRLGSDNYYKGVDASVDIIGTSAPVFFKYHPEKANNYSDGGDITDMCYGFATKTIDLATRLEYITIHPELVNGIRKDVFADRLGTAGKDNIEINKAVIGWDYHFNSYGNVVMMAQTGLLNQTPNTEWSVSTGVNDTDYLEGGVNKNLNNYYTQSYLGSNNTACVYDPISNKFGWEYLHIPENIGQLYNSGESEVIDPKQAGSTRLPLIDDAKNEVYKINKRLQYYSYCPDMVPYRNALDGDVAVGTSSLSNGGAIFKASGAIELSVFNTNLEPWTVFDAHTGVNLNFGKSCDKLNWDKSLLGIMGFTFEQFNPEIITQENNGTQTRLTFNNINEMYNPTTNSEVVSSDIVDYNITPFGATQFYPMPAFMMSIREFAYSGVGAKSLANINYYPAISIATNSIVLEATNLPKTVLNPYLNIRSDIIDESKYFGGLNSGLNYPICAVVNKINADKDFIQLDNSDIIFTCKKKMAISSITTIITDPDGSLALVDEGSSVIYKIQKEKSGKSLNIIGQILESEPKKK